MLLKIAILHYYTKIIILYIYIYIYIYINVLYKIIKFYLEWVGITLIQLNKQMDNVCFDFTSQVDIE